MAPPPQPGGIDKQRLQTLLTRPALHATRKFFVFFHQVRRHYCGRIGRVRVNNCIYDRQTQRVFLGNSRDVVTRSVDRVAFVLLVPFAEVGGLVHVLDYLPPAYAGVVSAE